MEKKRLLVQRTSETFPNNNYTGRLSHTLKNTVLQAADVMDPLVRSFSDACHTHHCACALGTTHCTSDQSKKMILRQ